MITIDTQRGLYDSHLYDQDDLARRPILRISLTSNGVSGAGIDGWTNSFLFWEHKQQHIAAAATLAVVQTDKAAMELGINVAFA